MYSIYYFTPGNLLAPECLEYGLSCDLALSIASEYADAYGCHVYDSAGIVDLSEPFIYIG